MAAERQPTQRSSHSNVNDQELQFAIEEVSYLDVEVYLDPSIELVYTF